MSTNLVTLPDDALKLILYYVGKFGSLVLYFTNKRFQCVTEYDCRLLTFRQAIFYKSYSYIMFIQYMKNKTICIDKHYFKIFDTQNLCMIKMFVSKEYISYIKNTNSFKKQENKLLSHSSPEIIDYIFDNRFTYENVHNILQNERIDILNYYANTKKIHIVNKYHINDTLLTKTSSDIIIYLHDRGMNISSSCLFSIFKSNNLEHIKWGYNKFGKDEFIHNIKILLEYRNFICKKLVYWLHSNNILIPMLEYSTTVKNELNNILNGEISVKNTELDIPLYPIEKRNGIYFLDVLLNDEKNDKTEIENMIPSNTITLNSEECCHILEKYFDVITKSNKRSNIINYLLDKIEYDNYYEICGELILLAVEYYKKGLKCFLSRIADQIKYLVYYAKFDKEIFINIYESDDIDLIKIGWSLSCDAEYLIKYCSLTNILKLFSVGDTVDFPSNVIDAIVYRGSISIFRCYMIYGKLRPLDMYIGITRFPKLEDDILSLDCIKEFELIDYINGCILDKGILYRVKIGGKKKNIPLNKVKYYYFVLKIKANISDELIKEIIIKDDVIFYEVFVKDAEILLEHVKLAFVSGSLSILKYMLNTNKTVFPFCKTAIKNNNVTTMDIYGSILNSGCYACRNIILDLINNRKIQMINKVLHFLIDTCDESIIRNKQDICGNLQVDFSKQYRVDDDGNGIKVSIIECGNYDICDTNDICDEFNYSLDEYSDNNDLCHYDESEECDYVTFQ